MKICVYAISKNEEQFVHRFCESAKDADYILIADTGSTDDTSAKARECGALVYDVHINPWRFDLARNAALALVPKDVDVCISLDLDEVMEPGWREEIEAMWAADTTILWYMFDWGDGLVFPHRKIHSRRGYHWHHPCHEDLRLDPRVTEVCAWSKKVLVRHFPDNTKSRGQYMDILEAAFKEDARDPTHVFYYARELTFKARYPEAITALSKYLDMNATSNQNERSYAMRLMGKCHKEIGDLRAAEKWLSMATAESPDSREPWCEMAMLMYEHRRWEECYLNASRALKIQHRDLLYTSDPAVWGSLPHDLASVSAWYLGLPEISIQQAKLAVEKNPNDERLKKNLELVSSSEPVKSELLS